MQLLKLAATVPGILPVMFTTLGDTAEIVISTALALNKSAFIVLEVDTVPPPPAVTPVVESFLI